MSKTKIYKCPKCSKKSFTETKPNTFKCFACKHSENLNDLEWNWFVPAIAVGSLIGLFTIIILDVQVLSYGSIPKTGCRF